MMKRVVKYLLLLLCVLLASSAYSQQRDVIVNTNSTSRSIVVMDSTSNKNTDDFWAQLEQERITAEKAEQERIAAEKAKQERIAAEKKEAAKKKYNDYLQNTKIKTLIMGEVGYSKAPQLSYGVMFGQMYKGIGWFVSGRSNFNFIAPADLACDANGSINGIMPFYTDKTSTMHLLVNGGVMVNFLEWTATNKFNTFGMYVGAGYGSREFQLETTDGLKVKYAPTSPNGVSGTVGVFGSIYGLTLNLGVSTIAFKNLEVEAGIGYMF